jgi:hypothetical protein
METTHILVTNNEPDILVTTGISDTSHLPVTAGKKRGPKPGFKRHPRKTVNVCLHIDNNIYSMLRLWAICEDTSIASIVEEGLTAWAVHISKKIPLDSESGTAAALENAGKLYRKVLDQEWV